MHLRSQAGQAVPRNAGGPSEAIKSTSRGLADERKPTEKGASPPQQPPREVKPVSAPVPKVEKVALRSVSYSTVSDRKGETARPTSASTLSSLSHPQIQPAAKLSFPPATSSVQQRKSSLRNLLLSSGSLKFGKSHISAKQDAAPFSDSHRPEALSSHPFVKPPVSTKSSSVTAVKPPHVREASSAVASSEKTVKPSPSSNVSPITVSSGQSINPPPPIKHPLGPSNGTVTATDDSKPFLTASSVPPAKVVINNSSNGASSSRELPKPTSVAEPRSKGSKNAPTAPSLTSMPLQTPKPVNPAKKQVLQSSADPLVPSKPAIVSEQSVLDPSEAPKQPAASSPTSRGDFTPRIPKMPISVPQAKQNPITDKVQPSEPVSKATSTLQDPMNDDMATDELIAAPLSGKVLANSAPATRDSSAQMQASEEPEHLVPPISQDANATREGDHEDSCTVNKIMTRGAAKRAKSSKPVHATKNTEGLDKKESPSRKKKRRSIRTKRRDLELIVIDESEFAEEVAAIETGKRKAESVLAETPSSPTKKTRYEKTNMTGRKLRSSQSTKTASTPKRELKMNTENSPVLPNRYILRDGNTKSFWYTLLSGLKIAYSQWNLYNTSLSRLLNEDALTVCADMCFRELKLGPKDGFEWMHETLLLEKVFGCKDPDMDNFPIPIPRWQSILRSKTLFVPIFRHSHWSLLALSSCSSILDMILEISPSGNQSMPRRPIQIVAAHFDSLLSIGHSEHLENIKLILTKGILSLWEEKYKDFDEATPPKVKGMIESSLRILNVQVEQQPDGVTCGWRTLRHAIYVAENVVDSAASLKELAVTPVNVDFRDIAQHTIAKVLNLSKPSSTDIPTLLYPLHSLVDETVLSFFDATPENLASKVADNLCSGKIESTGGRTKRTNSTKKAQFQALKSVSAKVVAEMRKHGLDKKQVLRKDFELSQNMCTDIAKYLFHYPRGNNFAECLYYTRYHYPDSFLVCLGLDVLFSPKPRIFGESITPLSSRVRKSNSVHFQMSILRDQSRGVVRYYDELARFRLLEMVEHFKGVGEAIMKSCCRLALPSDEDVSECPIPKDSDNSSEADDIGGVGQEDGDEVDSEEEDDGNIDLTKATVDLIVKSTQEDNGSKNGWDFSSSISFHRPVDNELGHITSNVSARDIREHIDVCIASADKIANEAIMSRVNEFENQCKRATQLSNKSIKVSEMKQRVIGESLGSIPSLFANHFAGLLKKEIKQNWGHELPADFLDGKLNEMIRNVLSAANTLYRRNGKSFFRLTLKEDVLDDAQTVFIDEDDDIFTPVKKKSRRKEVVSDLAETKDDLDSVVPKTEAFVSFGLGMCTDLEICSTPLRFPDMRLFSWLFFVLKGCHSHPRIAESCCGDLENDAVTADSSPCYQRLKSVQEKCKRAMDFLQQSGSKMWREDGDANLRKQLQKMKFKILSKVSTGITATRYQHSSSGSAACRSNVFCYDIPTIDPDAEKTCFNVTDGKSFRIYHAGGQGGEEVMWNFEVSSLSYRAVEDKEAQLFRSTDYIFLSEIPISKSMAPPKMYILSADVDVLCTMDMWNEVEFEIDGDQYLGFSRFDFLKVVFSIQGEASDCTETHQSSDYNQSLIGIVMDDPITVGESGPRVGFNASDFIRMRSIGPRTCKINIIVQDDLAGRVGQSVSLPSFIDKWRNNTRTQATCRLVPVEGIDFRRHVLQYGSLRQLASLPKIFRLSVVDSRFAECYELERRKRHYQMMKHFLSGDPDQKYSFTPFKDLEDEWTGQIREAALSFDPALSDQQLRVIETALFGWKSDSSRNWIMVLEQISKELKSFMGNSRTITEDDIAWWGSSLCFLDGCPGSGKTRTVAALICTVLQRIESPSSLCGYTGPPRVLVVVRSGVAADDLFVRVYKLFRSFFRQNTAKCNNVLEKMVRVGSSFGREIVGRREASRLAQEGRAEDVVDKAMVVITTAADLHRKELQSCTLPFSLLVIEGASKMPDESLIQAACKAFLREGDTQSFQRVSLLMVGDGQESLKTIPENIFTRAMKNDTGCELSLRISLSHQYRSAPPITQFLSSTFHGGKLTSSEKHGMPWEEQNSFKYLRSNEQFPIRNFVVIDISLEGKVADDSAGSGKSLHNRFEKNVIAQMLLAWGNSDMKDELQKKITLLCMYPKQRIELARSLAKLNLSRINVRTMDQMVGLENDIIIVSLVRTRSQGTGEDDDVALSSAKDKEDAEWIRLAASRAKKAFIVVGNAKFMAEQSSHWAHLFQHCLSCVQEGDNASHGYFRPRYVGGRDLRLVPFSPSYMQV